jgi:hypothetical protein
MTRPAGVSNPHMQLEDLLVHEAGHAVIAWELGVEIAELTFDLTTWIGGMRFVGGMFHFEGDLGSEMAREAAELDLLVFHAGMVAQREFHYDSAHGTGPSVDLRGVMRTCQQIESDLDCIDAWSNYIEERVRVMVQRPATWRSILALAEEIRRRPVMTGVEISAFLRRIRFNEVPPTQRFPSVVITSRTAATSPAPDDDPRRVDDVLTLSTRARSCLRRGGIETVGALLRLSAWRLSGIRALGKITLAEIEAELAQHGFTLQE